MEVSALRTFVLEHGGSVRVRLTDGRTFDVPHRDYLSFPPSGRGTTVILWSDEGPRLMNTLLISEVVPLATNARNGKNGHPE